MADPDVDILLETCNSYLDTQHRLLAQAVALQRVPSALVIAMDAALDQLEAAVLAVPRARRPPQWPEPGE